MLSFMDKLRCTYLLVFWCFTSQSVYGEGEDLFPSCEVELMVRRHTAWRTPPRQFLRVECPAKHCGKSLNVTWCKISSKDHCDQIHQTENVEISRRYTEKTLISYLTFKSISISDDGLYRCALEGFKNVYGVSHIINISVSNQNHVVEIVPIAIVAHSSNTAQPLNSPALDFSWLPYFYICLGIALTATGLTVLTHLSFNGFKQTLNYKSSSGQEMSTSVIPDLPKRSGPSLLVLQSHRSVLNEVYFPGTSETPALPLSTMPNRDSAANESQVYAAINHRPHTSATRKQHPQTKSPDYATIGVH